MADQVREPSRASTQSGKTQNGSVIEFMFIDHGPGIHGYLATSYPYPTKKVPLEKRIIAREKLPEDMEEWLAEENPAYIINASANAFNCWFIVYLTNWGEYDTRRGGDLSDYPEITQRINDFENKNRGKVRSIAFGTGKEAVFLRASDGQHRWSFRWKDLPFDCEMVVQDSIQQSGWMDRRHKVKGKRIERKRYNSIEEEDDGESISKWRDDGTNKRAPGCIRFLTLSKNGGWIIYGETWHIWDKSKDDKGKSRLPPLLLKGLEMGRVSQWLINKVELSLFNEEEYVLVYDEGSVFYNIVSPTFVVKFKGVVEEWAKLKDVPVTYYDKVASEKEQLNPDTQRYRVPHEDGESTNSQDMRQSTGDRSPQHPGSAAPTVYYSIAGGASEPFPPKGDEARSINPGIQPASRSSIYDPPPQSPSYHSRTTISPAVSVPNLNQQHNVNGAGGPSRLSNQSPGTIPTSGNKKGGPRGPTAGKKDNFVVKTLRKTFNQDKTN